MAEISNKTVISLLVVAIVVSLVGTFMSLDRLGRVQIPLQVITGAVSNTGTTVLNVGGTLGITASDSSIDFGTAVFNSSCASTVVATVDSDATTDSCWVNTSQSGRVSTDDNHILNNTGTLRGSINVTLGNPNVEYFICGADNGCADTNTAQIAVRMEVAEGEVACTQGTSITAFASGVLGTGTGATTGRNICPNMLYDQNVDELAVQYQLFIPSDIRSGVRTETITYTIIESTY